MPSALDENALARGAGEGRQHRGRGGNPDPAPVVDDQESGRTARGPGGGEVRPGRHEAPGDQAVGEVLRIVLDAGFPDRSAANQADDVGDHRLLAHFRRLQIYLPLAHDRGGIDRITGPLVDRHRLAGEHLLVDGGLALEHDPVDGDELARVDHDLVALGDLGDLDADLLVAPDHPGVLDVGLEEALDRPPGLVEGEVAHDVSERDQPHHHAGSPDLSLNRQDGGRRGVEHVDVEPSFLRDGLGGSLEDRDRRGRQQPARERGAEEHVGGDRSRGQAKIRPGGGILLFALVGLARGQQRDGQSIHETHDRLGAQAVGIEGDHHALAGRVAPDRLDARLLAKERRERFTVPVEGAGRLDTRADSTGRRVHEDAADGGSRGGRRGGYAPRSLDLHLHVLHLPARRPSARDRPLAGTGHGYTRGAPGSGVPSRARDDQSRHAAPTELKIQLFLHRSRVHISQPQASPLHPPGRIGRLSDSGSFDLASPCHLSSEKARSSPEHGLLLHYTLKPPIQHPLCGAQ